MRILNLADRAWPVTSGSQVYLDEISRRWARDGHTVRIYTTDADDLAYFWDPHARRLTSESDVREGVEIRRFPVRHLPASRLGFPLVRRLNLLLGRLPAVPLAVLFALARVTPWVPALERALESLGEPFEWVHAINLTLDSLSLAAFRFARQRGILLAYTPFLHLGNPTFYTMRHQLAMLKAADAVFAQTELEKGALAAGGIARDRIHVVGIGVNPAELEGGDAARFRAKQNISGPIVFFMGVNAEDKGAWQTVRAMPRVWARGLAATLVVAGPRTEGFDRFLRGCPEDIRGRVRVLGYLSDTDKRDLLAAGDIFVLPSRTESFGIVYLEAWLYNKPVIGARAGGVPEVITEGRDGLLVPFGDEVALAEAIARLLSDPAQAHALGAAGRARVLAEMTWEDQYARLRSVLPSTRGARTLPEPAPPVST